MIILLASSKTMNMAASAELRCTVPELLEHSEQLMQTLRPLPKTDLAKLMKLSDKLTEQTHQRIRQWHTPFTADNAKQALFAFTGDVYDSLNAPDLSGADIDFAQNHLRILSGLYGLLRPLDLIQPYRLEMACPLSTPAAKNLYGFWRDTLTDQLNQLPGNTVINLASQEYFKALDPRRLNKQIVTPVFKDQKNGRLKIISLYAKRARGSMARHIIRNRINIPNNLLSFAENGYAYAADLSTPEQPVFTRTHQSDL